MFQNFFVDEGHSEWFIDLLRVLRFYLIIIGVSLCQVILCDDEGKQIDEQFLGGDREIKCGKPLKLERHVVEVLDIIGGFRPLADVVVIQDSPVNQKKLHQHHLKSSFQGFVQPPFKCCLVGIIRSALVIISYC